MANDSEYLRDRAEVTFEVPLPQNFKYCVDTYKMMADAATQLTAEQTDGVPMFVWEGFFTKLITEDMGLSVPYFTTIRRELIRMECIRQMRRGGGSSPSQWELLQAPSVDLWHSSPAKRSQTNSKQDMTAGQVGDLTKRLEVLEQHMQVILDLLTESNARVPFDEPKREGAGPKVFEVKGG